MKETKSYEDLCEQIEELKLQLREAKETLNAIRTGQVDALVVQTENGPQLYTLKTADPYLPCIH
jgi:two-component system CheB/CheR fusion protein